MPFNEKPTVAEHVHAADKDGHDLIVEVVDQSRQKQSWVGKFLWDTADLSREERRLLFKVDASLLIFASVGNSSFTPLYDLLTPFFFVQLGYFIKNLDQSNVNSAFLSGMKEEL